MVDAREGGEDADAEDSANDDPAAVSRAPLPTPSVGAAFRSGFPGSALHVILLGLGVATTPCLGFGFLFLWVGSSILLVHVCAPSCSPRGPSNG